MKKIFVFVVIILLSSCAAHDKLYKGKTLPANEIATLTGATDDGSQYGYTSIQIRELDGFLFNRVIY